MLTQCLPGMKWPEVAAALGLLDDEDFKTVSAKVKKIKVRNTESNRRLVNEMRSEGVLGNGDLRGRRHHRNHQALGNDI